MRGRIYCNPDDKSLFVRRRTPGAWTMNLGNPWVWSVAGAAVLAALLLRLCGV